MEEGTAQESVALGNPRVSSDARRDWQAAELKNAKELSAKARRKAAACAVPACKRVHGEAVFLADGARQALDKPQGAWARLRKASALREVSEQHMASFVVALDPTALGDRAMVNAGMLGQSVCSPSYLSSGTGPRLQLKLGVRAPRFIFVSAKCAAKHGPMLALMKANSQRMEGSRWRWLGPAQNEAKIFLDRATKRTGAHKSEIVTLVVPDEMDAADMARFPRKMALRSFVKEQIWQIDRAQSQMGVCGR